MKFKTYTIRTFSQIFLLAIFLTGCFGYENPGAPRGLILYTIYYPNEMAESELDYINMLHVANPKFAEVPFGYLQAIYYSREPESISDEKILEIAIENFRSKFTRIEPGHTDLLKSKAPFDYVQIRIFRVDKNNPSSLGEYRDLVIVSKANLLDLNIAADEIIRKAKVYNVPNKKFDVDYKFINEHFMSETKER